MTFINASETDLREANQMVPDLYRPTDADDVYQVVRNGDGWTTALHESYDDETIEEHVAHRSTFATKALAEQWAWYWIVEMAEDETEYYSDAAKALLEGLKADDWTPNGRVFDFEAEGWRYDGSLDSYDESLHRMVVTLKRGEEVRKFLTVEDAHTFICEEADDCDFTRFDTTLLDGSILTKYVR